MKAHSFLSVVAHLTYVAHESIIGPMVFSLVFDGLYYRGILRTEQGSERFVVSAETLEVPWFRKLLGLGPPWSTIIKAMSPTIPLKQLKLCKDPNAPRKVLAMDERLVIRHFKFGILYVLPHQLREEEMFGNRHRKCHLQGSYMFERIDQRIRYRRYFGSF